MSRRAAVFVHYAAAVGATAAAVLLRWLLDPVLGDALPLVTLFGAVAAAAWVGGYGPGVLATLLGYAACHFLFIQPRWAVDLWQPVHAAGLAAYLFTCALIIAFAEAARAAQGRASRERELMQVTLRSIGDAVITSDVQGRITDLNAVAESLTGWTRAEALGQPLDAVFHILNEETREPVASPAERALREGVVVGLANHTVLVRRDGGESPIDDSAAPIRDPRNGHVSGCVLVFRDVAEQRRRQQERARELLTARLLASIVESSDDAIVSKSLDGVIQSWNAAAERLFGHTSAEAVGRHISLIIPPDRLGEEDEIIATLKAGRRVEHYETERLHRDGRRVQVSITVSPIRDGTGQVVGASKIARDVAERRRAEAERQRFVTLVENSTDFIGICGLDAVPSFVNRAGLEMVGLDSLDEARAKRVEEFFFPEDRPRVMEELFPQVLEKGHGEMDLRFRHFKTGEARWMSYKVLALSDGGGRPTAIATVSQDVTERRQLEDNLRRLAADLSEAAHRKDEFLAMLAHELRNALAPISNAVQVQRLAAGDAEAAGAASEVLRRQVSQMGRLVDDLLDMSRITQGRIELRLERVDLAPVLSQAVEALRPLYAGLGHELAVTLPPRALHVNADPTRLAQAVGNLLNNAAKFTDRGGHIALDARAEGPQAVIRVRDDGIGIAAGELPRLFEMFRQVDTSLERSRGGLGIGLTLVKTLVEMHGGTVEAHSAGLGHGSEFVIRLPVLADAPRALPRPPAAAGAAAPGRRVLIVDDNADGAESLAMLLSLGGHEPHTARDGEEALEAAARLRPHAVLLDIGLPKLNGYEVCRRLRQEPWGKDMLVVAMTGWGQDQDRSRSSEAGFDAHLVKPVDHEALRKLLASLPPPPSPTSS